MSSVICPEGLFSKAEDESTVQVGSVAVWDSVKLTRVVKENGGTIVFKDELDSEYSFIPRRIVPAPAFNRLEIKVSKGNGGIREFDDLVYAVKPYGTRIVSASQFRPSSHHPRFHEGENTSFESTIDFLENRIQYDYFETGDKLTACINRPESPFIDEDYWIPKKSEYVFGVCEDFIDLRNSLYTCPEILKVLGMTERNELMFWRKRLNVGKLFLADFVKDNASLLMLLSISQALAGPSGKHVQDWLGRPVWEYAVYLYKYHLNNDNRREPRTVEFVEEPGNGEKG